MEASDGDTNDVEKLTSQCNKLEEKLARATSKLTEMRNQCQQYKRDLKTTQMVHVWLYINSNIVICSQTHQIN